MSGNLFERALWIVEGISEEERKALVVSAARDDIFGVAKIIVGVIDKMFVAHEDDVPRLAMLFASVYTGIPEGFNMREIVGGLTDASLKSVVMKIGEGEYPGTACLVEILKRNGAMKDWEFDRESPTNGWIKAQLNYPVKFEMFKLEG
jgi:hypothetical protein